MIWSQAIESILRNSEQAAILLMNRQGKILDINTAVTKIFGFDRGDLIGENFEILFTEEDRLKNKPEKEVNTVSKEGTALDKNYVVQKNGKPLWCSGESILLKTEEGKTYFLKVILNINNEKLLEEYLTSRNEELQQARQDLILTIEELTNKNSALVQVNNDLDNFVHTVSHDLKAPVDNLAVLIDMLRDQVEPSGEAATTIKMITTSVHKLKYLLSDLATSARAQANLQSCAELVSLSEVMDEVKFNLKHQTDISGAVIEEDFLEVPSLNIPRKDIRSILQNLISNAIKYRSKERVLKIKISAGSYGNEYVVLSVADNGLGIKKEDQEKIFTMYTRAHECAHRHIDGTGVGLAIVKRMVENHGGKIEVESTEGKGSTFIVYLKQA